MICKYCKSQLKIKNSNNIFNFYECSNKKCKVIFKIWKNEEKKNDKNNC